MSTEDQCNVHCTSTCIFKLLSSYVYFDHPLSRPIKKNIYVRLEETTSWI